MRRLYSTFIVLSLLSAGVSRSGADESPMECGNERYEDFMQLQYQKEKLEQDRQRYADEIKEVRAERKRLNVEARKSYVRPPKVDDTAGEKAYQEHLKAEKEERDLIRRRYVENRDKMRKTVCHGLKIPELKEYDLENY